MIERTTVWMGRLCGALVLSAAMVLAASPSHAQVALPFDASGVQLDDLADQEVILLDLGSLPLRAGMTVEVTPDTSHPDLELEIEVTACPILNDFGSCPTFAISSPAVGPNSATASFVGCSPTSPFPGQTCEARVRVLDFGAGGAPASVDVSIRGFTQVPTGTVNLEYNPIPQQETVTLGRNRDTTVYEEDSTGSNGQGPSIWAAERFAGSFPSNLTRYDVRGLVSFDVAQGFLGRGLIPEGSTIDDVEIILNAIEVRGSLSSIDLEPVTVPSPPSSLFSFFSGDAVAPGDELQPGTSIVQSTTWTHRLFSSNPWSQPGVPTDGVVATAFATLGDMSFQSPALTAAVEQMWLSRADGAGFRLKPTSTNPFLFADQGVRFASGEHPNANIRPLIIIDYTPDFSAATTGQTLQSGTVPFIGEGENFRWIYDDDGDDILFTDIGGRCEETALNEGGGLSFVPYNYSFQGDPAYEGLDCCTWQIESQATGTIGSGQAIFFLNVDSQDPANQPGDLDGDGIRDLCDNCPYVPNGPLLGTCIGGPDDGEICRSNQECGGTSFCSLSQEDDDFVLPGQACPVPEPGTAGLLLAGTLWLVALRRGPGSARD